MVIAYPKYLVNLGEIDFLLSLQFVNVDFIAVYQMKTKTNHLKID